MENYSSDNRSKLNAWVKDIDVKVKTLLKKVNKVLIWSVFFVGILALLLSFRIGVRGTYEIIVYPNEVKQFSELSPDVRNDMLEDGEFLQEEIDTIVQKKIDRHYNR